MKKKQRKVKTIALAAAVLSAAPVVRGEVASLSKGQEVLVARGLQLGGVIANTADPFHLTTLQSMNYTVPLWAWTPDVSKLGAAPGAPWSKWIDYTTQTDLPAGEQAYKSQLVSMGVGDEQDLSSSTVYSASVSWFNNYRGNFPTT